MEERTQKRTEEGKEDKNMMDCFLAQVEEDKRNPEADNCKITMDIALYALEEILGGHVAVANFAARTCIDICAHPGIQATLRQELQETLMGSEFTLADRNNLPFLQATVLESLRVLCPLITPHVASRDTTIGGLHVEANTVVFINNHYSNFQPDLWQEPEIYNPHRFLDEGIVKKPAHFQPFSMGWRSCIGYKTVDNVISSLLAAIFCNFELSCPESLLDQPGGMVALDTKPFYFAIRKLLTPLRRNA